VLERVLYGFEHRRAAAPDQLGPSDRKPRLGKRKLVAYTGEDGQSLLGDCDELGARPFSVVDFPRGLRRDPSAQKTSAQGTRLIADGVRARCSLAGQLSGPGKLSGQEYRLAEIEPEHDRRVVFRPERGCTLEKLERRVDVVASERPGARPRQALGGPKGQVGRALVDNAELKPVEVSLLEVIADELVDLLSAPAALEPVGVTLVQSGAQAFRHRLISDVADE
jgi:hypothetical protein